MAYLGNAPARSFISFERQVFTIVNSQTAYTLSHSVTNENDIRLVINNIVQEPGSGKAYTASGTTLTLSAALTNGTDEMYCVFLGRATATNAPAAGSVNTAAIADLNVTTAKIAADAITEAKIADDAVESEHLNNNVISGQTELAAEPADTDEFLVSDAGTLKRIDYSHIKASPGLIKISRTDISSSPSTVAFNGVFSSTYRNYFIIGSGINFASNSVQLRSRLGVGTAYETGGYLSTVVSGSYAYNGSNAGGSNYQSTGNFILNEFTVTANQNDLSFFAYVFIPNIANMNTSFSGRSVAMQQDSGYMIGSSFQGQLVNNAQITDINFFPSSGNFGNTGEITVFGIKES